MLHPWMLFGLLGLSVPIVIHLIQRRRLKPQLLATLQFLDQEDVANAFSPVPRDILQLLLRLLLLAVLILLMSRLVVGGKEIGPRTMAAVFDQSMSMQQKVGEAQSLFQRHQSQLLELVDGLRPQDKMSLTLVGDRVTVETGYLQDKAELRKAALAFEVSDSGGLALLPAFRSAVNQLRSRREVNACVIVFSDHQAANYLRAVEEARQEGEANPAVAFREGLEGSTVKLFLIDERPGSAENLAIETASFSPERVHVGASSRFTATVRNYTDKEKVTSVTFHEGDKAGEQRNLSLQPGEAAHIDIVHRFESPIDVPCNVEIDDDILPGDNRYHVPMRMKERRQVLLVSPRTETEEEAEMELSYQGVDLLAYALNPGEALGLGTGTAIHVKRITPRLLERVSLPMYSVIIFYGVAEMGEQSHKDLLAFVQNGGGLYIIPSREMTPLRFNEVYGPLLKSFTVGQLKQPEEAQRIDRNEAQLTHPLLLPLLREEWGDSSEIYLNEYLSVESPGQAEVALRAANGDWLVAVVRHERGQVGVQLFSNDLESSSLPRSAAFVPMAQEVVSVLRRLDEEPRPEVMRVGDILRVGLPEFRGLTGNVVAAGPEKQEFSPTKPGAEEVRVEGLLKAGAYEISHPAKKSGRKRWLTVNPVLGESGMAALSEADQALLFGQANVHRLPYAELAEHFASREEILRLMTLLVLVAFVIEAVMGAWQSRAGARESELEAPAP